MVNSNKYTATAFRRILVCMLSVALGLALVPALPATQAFADIVPLTWEGEGSGSSEYPYLITSANDLQTLANKVKNESGQTAAPFNDGFLGKYFKLTDNIDLSTICHGIDEEKGWTTAINWTPIGAGGTKAFKGIFDGDNHVIKGLYMNGTASTGLFGYTKGATLKNFIVEGEFTCTGTVSAAGVVYNFAVGDALQGTIAGEIKNVGNRADVTHTGASTTGGIVGTSSAACQIVGCYNAVLSRVLLMRTMVALVG
jgi:hypothetical protein